MTNYERIKNMSVEEMAEFICSIFDDMIDFGKDIDYDEHKIAEWLDLVVE